MKIGTMFSDVTRSFFKQPVTEKYPVQRYAVPERLRGQIAWHPEKCTGCGMCATDCPANALEMIVIDKKEKRFVLRYHADRCTFCAQCVHSCMHGCLEMSQEYWELAALSRVAFTIYYGDEKDVEHVLAGPATSDDESVAES